MECVFKIAPLVSGKQRFITFQNSFHGVNWGSASLTGHKVVAKFVGAPGVTKIPYAYCYRCPFKQEYPGCGLACLEYIEKNILKTVSPPEYTAAIVVEPIQSDGGDVVPPQEFLKGLETICKENEMYFIVDEVKVGMGRTGKLWAFEHSEVIPDMMAVGKGFASGMPLSAVVARADILDRSRSGYAITSGGHPVCCAAGVATFKTIEEDGLLLNAEKIGNFILTRLNKMKEKHKIIGDVRGKGLFIGVELVKDRETKEPASRECAKVVCASWEMGLLLGVVGTYENVIEITPPLIMTEAQAQKGLDILEEVLDRVEKGKVSDEVLVAFEGW
jgi:4-aminobutyrate aminotransferase